MATGQSGYDADDFFDQRRYDYQREQDLSDRAEQDRRRDDNARRAAIEEQRRIQLEANRARLDAMRRIVNDDDVELSPEEVEIINNKETRMMPNGEIVNRRKNGLRTIRSSGQFALQNIIPNLAQLQKRKRKKLRTLPTIFHFVRDLTRLLFHVKQQQQHLHVGIVIFIR